MKKWILVWIMMAAGFNAMQAQQIKLNFAGNLNDWSINQYHLDTNLCGPVLSFCSDASGNANNAYEFDGICSMKTDSFSMTSTTYPGMSLSFYMYKNFDSDSIRYGIFHFYKGPFLVYAQHDSLFITITDSLNNDYTYGAPCAVPDSQWFCGVISFRDFGDVDFYINKNKFTAGTTNFKILRRDCVPGFCYWFSLAPQIFSNQPFKGRLDDVRVWNWPSDSVNVDEICTKAIVPQGVSSFEQSGARFYPNPAGAQFSFEAPLPGQVDVLDMSGRMLQSATVGIGINILSVTSLSSGTYILHYRNRLGCYSSILQVQ